MPCHFCLNSTCDSQLTPENDLSYISIGFSEKGFNFFFRSGDNRYTGFELDYFFPGRDTSNTVAYYVPKYCPECGRYLKENEFFRELQNNKSSSD